MAVPTNFPLRFPTGIRSLRFFVSDTATADYADTAFFFIDGAGANPYQPTPYLAPGAESTPWAAGNQTLFPGTPLGTGRNANDANLNLAIASQAPPVAMIWCANIRIINNGGGDLFFTFDGTNDHGVVKTGTTALYRNRYECGIAFRGAAVTFHCEAW